MQEVIDVVPVTRQINLLTLGDVIEQAVVSADEPLKKEFMERINKVNIEIASIKQLNERDSLKNEIAELQNEVRSVKLLALDYDAQLKKLDAYLKESSRVVPRKTIFECIFKKKK